MNRPTALPVVFQNIPEQLKALDRWVLWRFVLRRGPDGKEVWTKVPFTTGGTAASSNNPKTWTTYDDAADTLIFGEFDGIGVMLGDDLHGIDLDDCRDPETGDLLPIALEVLEKVDGYAEVSPSGTGLKIFTNTNLDRSRTKKSAGVELYRDGRYFTVTGHSINGHCALPGEVQDLGWFVQKVWGEELSEPGTLSDDAAAIALANYREPLEGWDLDRVVEEILPHLDPDCGYEEWLKIGAAMHHQGQGDEEWLTAWDEWSAGSGKYVEGYCEDKWKSFHQKRAGTVVTLGSLIKQTKPARQQAVINERQETLDDLILDIELTMRPQDLQERIAAKAAHDASLSDMDRETIAAAIRERAKELGVPMPIGTIRGWLRPRVQSDWPHINEDGNPLCTLENLRILLARLGMTVRYNVIKKAIDILVPGAAFTRDNRDNAAIAHVLSECEKVRMPTKHVAQYLISIADENQYNPVLTWIESVPWDGTSRLQAFCDTVRSESALKDKLMKKWLVQAVAAAASPDGVANQGILTFVGPQNIGKTTWFQRLAPPELDAIYTGLTLDLKSKDSIFVGVSHWIVELGEVDATMRKSDISALKSFITQPMDKIRRPYAATESQFGRRTAFGASVNDEIYLHDPTGNRRFWSILVQGFDLAHSIDMQQLWAEVLHLWRSGERWFLSQDEVAELNEHNEDFTAVDPVEERIASGFAWGPPVGSWEWVTATDALTRIGVKDPGKSATIIAGRVLRKLNGGQRRKSNGKVVFAVPAENSDFLG